MAKQKLLFICTANQQRSPTAAALFKNSDRYESRSAGTHPLAWHRINQEDVDWADIIFVMEDVHRHFIEEHLDVDDKPIIVLDIPDRFAYEDEELVIRLKNMLRWYNIAV